ncbi:sulfurtransferase complex subunit TusB [Gilliamella sp. B3791]|uniref:sulfurtransferase complex subunit TusB n=1 Tax=unclassified Gilliamella TaxID=2685620 RepID=UPI00226982AE|nr:MULTISPECIES: sulfurtransferase complex subunit TusB [unclassified Gilliamella]MCX8642761.1 sulfurtransferase complex subunit TusB [Gilliamella sp. B3835]MCX8708009.1 sulfurtransferase complex subunit TusB [Gilliamella sp. B3783]MCX8709101.1 sulfurtransferase complex subunit TusB [Gilliamella sp. B3780]MCX8717204.1 sulfurtransferase complex subunit TusB [Gilliamella sp. B3784]MCX8719684.1 sulfurtransferase complex subunit TusB [Gilliamella sp. B3788]
MLHTISTHHSANIDTTLISTQDAVLFWQNGVMIACQNNPLLNDILQKTTHCYVLDNDIIARGISQFIDVRLEIITMQQVVELTAKYYPQINWE